MDIRDDRVKRNCERGWKKSRKSSSADQEERAALMRFAIDKHQGIYNAKYPSSCSFSLPVSRSTNFLATLSKHYECCVYSPSHRPRPISLDKSLKKLNGVHHVRNMKFLLVHRTASFLLDPSTFYGNGYFHPDHPFLELTG